MPVIEDDQLLGPVGADADHHQQADLVLAAIVLRNTIGLERVVETLRTQGTAVSDELPQHLSPLGWERIILTGEYRWDLQQTSLPNATMEAAGG